MTATAYPARSYRTETDLLGEIAVPSDALWGAHTQRAIKNFPLRGSRTIGDLPELINALVAIKHATATANHRAGVLTHTLSQRIREACDELLDDLPTRQFPVHVLHGGGGTSANMNVNEVVANLAAHNAGEQIGTYLSVHPTGHVNLNQSTNDTFPTACRLAIRSRWANAEHELHDALQRIETTTRELADEPRLARTCLQDAVPATFGDLFGAYHSFLTRGLNRIAARVNRLQEVSLGGIVMGRTDGVPPSYLEHVVADLAVISGWTDLTAAANRVDAAQHMDDLVDVADALDVFARGLIRIAKDLRLIGSGPDGGFGEIMLAPRQAGSSAMPGKVNPVMPEHAVLLAWQATSAATMVRSTLDHAELDLNVWESTALVGVVDAMDALVSATAALSVAFDGITVRRDVIASHLDSVIPLAVRAAHQHGHITVEHLASASAGDGDVFRRELKVLLDEVELS